MNEEKVFLSTVITFAVVLIISLFLFKCTPESGSVEMAKMYKTNEAVYVIDTLGIVRKGVLIDSLKPKTKNTKN